MINSSKTNVEKILNQWQDDSTTSPCIIARNYTPAIAATIAPLPDDLHPELKLALETAGVKNLYKHQRESYDAVKVGANIVVTTSTASGKSLCYQLPILDSLLKQTRATALFLFPTKALTYDQLEKLKNIIRTLAEISPEQNLNASNIAVYDGDTPQADRSGIRKNARILLSNPDMIHTGILPHHTLWADFFENLKFIVIDELHIYRGVFGSHIANLLRRLQRIANFYGSFPQFILTSATISNPHEFAEKLIEAPIQLIDQDGAPKGPRNFLLYNPPIVNKELGVRRSAMSESIRLVNDLLAYHLQTIFFAQTRRATELALRFLKQANPFEKKGLAAYRSGYLPRERRQIEEGLRDGKIRAVVATNALELGVDIGGMEAVVIKGYPGTIAATRQQSGRAGRHTDPSLSILVASSDPLDQYLVKHPEYLLGKSPEKALINPDNPVILLQHLRCAAFELPFLKNERFGTLPAKYLDEFLIVLENFGDIRLSGNKYFWLSDNYPAQQVSLRSGSLDQIRLQILENGKHVTIGEVDGESANWMVHPDAVYLHQSQSYIVKSLDFENKIALLEPGEVEYYTEAQQSIEIEKISLLKQKPVKAGICHYGELLVTSQVKGYRKIRWETNETLEGNELTLPATHLRTMGYWLSISEHAVQILQDHHLWSASPNDYGPQWDKLRRVVRHRDQYTCQLCGVLENGKPHHVHHKIPFRQFASTEAANQLDNLITLCASCHRKVETAVRLRSGLAGLKYVLNHLSPLFIMCDINDLGASADPQSSLADGEPCVIIFDQVPAGIGLSEEIYAMHDELMIHAYELVSKCDCDEGCPSCVGVGGENGMSGKRETLAILAILNGNSLQV